MKDILFRAVALALACAIAFVYLFTDSTQGHSAFAVFRDFSVGIIFLIYAAGGNRLLQKLPILKHFSSPKN